MVLCCSVTTAEVPVHVDTSPSLTVSEEENAAVPVHVNTIPPLAMSAEENFIALLNKAAVIVDRLKDTSTAVICLLRHLKLDVDEYEGTVIQDQLRQQFEAALYQGGVPTGMVPPLALMFAHNAVKDIIIVPAMHGD